MGERIRVRTITLLFAFISGTAGAAPARATPPTGESAPPAGTSRPGRAECLAAHHQAQELKRSDKLIEAQQQLLICSSETCPGALIADCGAWIAEVEQITPSMVLEVRLDGKQVDGANLFVDRQPITDWSHAVKVNPGRHLVRAELPGLEPREQNVVLPEGQRLRLISIDFKSPEPAPARGPTERSAPDPGPAERPVPTVVYPLLGVGVAGLASFAAFAVVGRSKQTDLERSCQPRCTDSDLAPMKTAYLIGDISAGVAVAALFGAAAFYFSRAPEKSAPAPALSIELVPFGTMASRQPAWGGRVTTSW
jgi:hypothetical protein